MTYVTRYAGRQKNSHSHSTPKALYATSRFPRYATGESLVASLSCYCKWFHDSESTIPYWLEEEVQCIEDRIYQEVPDRRTSHMSLNALDYRLFLTYPHSIIRSWGS